MYASFSIIVTWCFHIDRLSCLFEHCHMTFPVKEIFSFLDPRDICFPYMEHHFLIKLFKNSITLFFSFICLEIVWTVNCQLWCYKWYSVFTQFIQKSGFPFVKTHMKKNVFSKDYYNADHDDKICLLPNLSYQNVLKGANENFLPKLDAFCFTFHHNSVTKLLSRVHKCLIMCREQSILFKEPKDRIQCPASRKRDSWGGSTEGIFELFQRTKTVQTSCSVFAERIEQVEKTTK